MGGRRKAYPKAWFWKSRSRQRSLSRPFRSFSTRERRQRERLNITFVILVSTEHLPSGHEGGAVPIDVRGPDYPRGSRLRFMATADKGSPPPGRRPSSPSPPT